MNKITFASVRRNAGKTSIIAGLAGSSKKKCGYMKPFGDRLLYKKKRLWDYDSALITNLFSLDANPEEMSLGFEHSKIRHMYDEATVREKLSELAEHTGKGKDILLAEGGADLSFGASVHLDSVSINEHIGGKLIIIVCGNEDTVLDDVTFIKKYIDSGKTNLEGVIINKVQDVEDFKSTCGDALKKTGINILGFVPYVEELTHFTVSYLSDVLFAKVIAGADGLNNSVKTIFVGAMSASEALQKPFFHEKEKLIITSGDRSDMIVAAIETGATGIVLSNNIMPSSNIVSMATEKKIPLLLVSPDTYQVAKHVDEMEPLMTKDEADKLALLTRAVKDNVSISLG